MLLRLLAAACLVLAIGAAGRASAHAVLLDSTPADGARLESQPEAVVLTFSEPVLPIAVQVLDGAGDILAGTEDLAAEGAVLRLALPPLAEGSYVASYRVTSADGHPVAGAIVFALGTDAAGPPGVAAPELAGPGRLAAANRAIHYAALLAAAGGALFLLTAAPAGLSERLRGYLALLILVAALTGVAAIGLGGAVLRGTPLSGLAAGETWMLGLRSTLGWSIAAAEGGLLLLALALLPGARLLLLPGARLLLLPGARLLLLPGAAIALLSLALTGHAATAPPRWLAAPVVWLHAVTASFWLGALWPLLVVLRDWPAAAAYRVVRRFSRLAMAGVALLIAAGLLLSALQLRQPAAVLETAYGWIWLCKVALVLALLCLAGLNRHVLTRRLAGGSAAAARPLKRSIAAELGLMAGIVAATALLGQTPPPRALEQAAEAHRHEAAPPEEGYRTIVASRQGAALLAATPLRPGRNHLTVTFTDPAGRAVEPLEIAVAASLPAAGLEPILRSLAAEGGGRFGADIDLPLDGLWSLRLDALVSDFEKWSVRALLPLGGAGSGPLPEPGIPVATAAWSRATSEAATTGLAYLTLANGAAGFVRLVGATTPAAAHASLHTSVVSADGVVTMAGVDAVTVPPGETAIFAPGGLHVMLHGLTAPLREGTTFPLTLHFADAEDVTIAVAVGPPGATGP